MTDWETWGLTALLLLTALRTVLGFRKLSKEDR